MIDERDMMHGTHYRGQRLRGWLISEKLDGVRAYWCGNALWSRSGRVLHLPRLTRWLPVGVPLDGELFAGYGTLAQACLAATHGQDCPALRFVAFDAPSVPGGWGARLAVAAAHTQGRPGLAVVSATLCEGERHAARLLGEVQARGGEGLMLRHPTARHAPGRHPTLVKLKRPYYATFLGCR